MKRLFQILGIVLGILLIAILVIPLLIPVPPLVGTLPPDQLADQDSNFVEVDDIKIHYKKSGQGGYPLILMHGFAASTFSWREVIGPLSADRQVIAYDRPAFGLTERPMKWEGPNPFSQEYQADQSIKLMDQLGIDKAILVGNSVGGTIAVLTALRHPERVQALILVDPAIYTGVGNNWMRLLANTPQMRHLGPLLVRKIQDWGYEFGRSAWHDPEKFTIEIWEGYKKPLKAENWDRGLWELTRASHPIDFENQLKKLAVPVLVITGDDDHIVPTEQSVRLANELQKSELVVIPQCGHVPQEECPQQFLEAVNHFLNNLPG